MKLIDKIERWLPEIYPVFAWYDLWVGAYWDRKNRKLYLLPIPCIGWVFDWSATNQTPVVPPPEDSQSPSSVS